MNFFEGEDQVLQILGDVTLFLLSECNKIFDFVSKQEQNQFPFIYLGNRWGSLHVSLCFRYRFVALEILYRMVYNTIVEVLFDYSRKSFNESGYRSIFSQETIGKNEYFCNNSGRARPIKLIFELDRDIVETKLCRKFHRDRTFFSKVIV